jgi:hypothetical protein
MIAIYVRTTSSSTGPIHELPAHNCRYHFARQLPAIERSVTREGVRLCRLERLALFRIEDGYVAMTAMRQGAAVGKVEDAGRACGKKVDDAGQ